MDPSAASGNRNQLTRIFETSSGIGVTGKLREERRYFASSNSLSEQRRTRRVPGAIVTRTAQILKLVSRAEHLKWREAWKRGRWVRLSWPPDERAAILRQDEEYRQADARWELNHGPTPGGAVILPFLRAGEEIRGRVTKQEESLTGGRVFRCAAPLSRHIANINGTVKASI